MKWLRKLQSFSYGVLIASVVWASAINMFFEQASEANWIEGLPVKVNAVSVMVTFAMALHIFVVHALIFVGDAGKADVSEIMAASLPYLMFMLPSLISPIVWEVMKFLFFILLVEFFIPDWPRRLLKRLQRRKVQQHNGV